MKTMIAIAMLALSGAALAQTTPVGVWKTIDDKTGTEKAQIRITETGGTLTGKLEMLLPADSPQDKVCGKCDDDRKDKPLVGMELIRGVKQGKDENTWDGGTALDAGEGKVYKVRLRPIDGGKKLEVHGYIGIPLLGRTQTWIRVE